MRRLAAVPTRDLLGILLAALLASEVLLPGRATVAAAECRVRNTTQGTHGRSLERMVAGARDGDRLSVRGTCRGGIKIPVDIVIDGGREATLTGLGRVAGVVMVGPRANVTLRGVTLEDGRKFVGGAVSNQGRLRLVNTLVQDNRAPWDGGGIYNAGRLEIVGSVLRRNHSGYAGGAIATEIGSRTTLRRTVVTRNSADGGGFGGGISNSGELTIRDSKVLHNDGWVGGGIYQGDGRVVIRRSVVSGNTASEVGGGIFSLDGVAIVDSTIADNAASTQGGGIFSYGLVAVRSTSITGNTAGLAGGGIYNDEGSVFLGTGVSVTGNSPDDCAGTPAC